MVSVQSVCRLPSSYLPLPSQDITAGRPSGGQGQPSCAVERLTSAASACVCVWHQSRSKMGRDVQDSLRSGPRDPPSLGERGKGAKAWGLAAAAAAPGNQAAAATGEDPSGGHGTWGIAIAKGGRWDQVLSAVRDGSVVERTDKDKVRVSKHSDQRLCKQEDSILGEITWMDLQAESNNPRASERGRDGRPCRVEERQSSLACARAEPDRGGSWDGSVSVRLRSKKLDA